MGTGFCNYDVIVIGGGINGAGIARDVALRNRKVLLLEARDFGSGTSSWSSRLIHGGLRYLEHGEIGLVYESLRERRTLRRIAPHLIRSLRLVIPLYRGGSRPPWLVRLGMLTYDLLSLTKSLPRHRMLRREALLQEAPGLNADGLLGGASYFDAQVPFAERLVIENVVAASTAGAEVRNYAPLTAIELREDGLHRVSFRDRGMEHHATARCIVNAAGPWVDRILAMTGQTMPRLIGGTKGSHVVVAGFEGAPRDAFYVESPTDGRPVFIIPWNGQYLIGTTDIRYDADPADARPGRDEIRYLLTTVNRIFPSARLTPADVAYAYAGVRPLPRQSAGPEAAITRRHIIHAHGGRAAGLWSIIGGKLTTYRSLAEQVVDRLEVRLAGARSTCTTADRPLPGGGQTGAAVFPRLPESGCRRLEGIYGSRSAELAALIGDEPELAEVLDTTPAVLAAEVVFAIRKEFARTLIDIVHRRLMTGLQGDLGAASADAIAGVAARELAWNDERRMQELKWLADYNRRLRVG